MRYVIPAFFSIGLLFAGLLSAPEALAKETGRASITVRRPDALYAHFRAVDVEVNGARVTKLENGATFTSAVAPGNTTLSVTMWDDPGRYKISFKAVAGRRYVFEITPRSEQFVAGALGGLAGLLIDTAINENSGAFKITPAR